MKKEVLRSTAWLTSLLALCVGCAGEIGSSSKVDPGVTPTGGGPGGPGGGGGTGVEPPPAALGPPALGQLRRLTVAQFSRALQDLLRGPVGALPTIEEFPANSGLKAIGASTTAVTQLGVEQYEAAVTAVVTAAFADPARRQSIVGCAPAAWDETCARTFLQNFGRLCWRRPLDADEIARYLKLGQDEAAAPGSFADGATAMAEALLQSPNFLYRVELGAGPVNASGWSHFSGYETATRLAFLLWSAPPDAELLNAAQTGGLDTPAGIAKAAQRLMASPRLIDGVDDMVDDMLGLDAVFMMTKDPKLYPQLTPSLRQAMRSEILKMFEDAAVTRDADLMELFDTNKTFVNQELGKLYGINANGPDLVAVQFPVDQPRAGILTTAALLTVQDKVYQTSPTRRGAFVRRVLTCDHIPEPPPNVNTNIMPPPGGAPVSRKKLLSGHATEPSCAGCHAMMDPVGLAFENFDAMAIYRTKDENGLAIDPSGTIDDKPFAGPRELGALLRQSDKVRACLTKNIYRFATGRVENDYDQDQINKLSKDFTTGGQKLRSLFASLAASDGFINVSPVKN